ncbi:MAG: hypothetical protein Ct9H90mP13_06130 [Pseudomonadota bacterium]|nr:MAG: hypothetical protein Ct9H90mP13_06130 [Pseudomonadota bacterium]
MSFQIAAITATFATIMGTMAGFIMARIKKFRGRLLFSGMIASPLVMPEVITGLSLLLLFVSLQDFIGWPTSRGYEHDYDRAYHIFHGLCCSDHSVKIN